MIVENTKNIKKNLNPNLIERYGEGVHLIQSKMDGKYCLMVCDEYLDKIVFMERDESYPEELNLSFSDIEWEDFEEDNIYIKKLTAEELIVRLK